tara:strand:+ start:2248 stop:3285 length:1038 start_codon:yes stop_codon:yes gene_type:complete
LTVSVIVLADGKGRLDRAIDSVLSQKRADVEVLVVARKPVKDIDALASKKGVEVFSPGESLSRAVAANEGIERCRGDWVTVIDGADWFDADHFATMVATASRSRGNLLVYSGVQLHGGSRVRDRSPGYWRQRLFEQPLVPACGVMFSKELVVRHGCRFDPQFALFEDWDFLLQCSALTDFLRAPGTSARHDESVRKPRENSVSANIGRLQKKWGAQYEEVRSLADGAAHQAAEANARRSPRDAMRPLRAALQVDPGNPALLSRLALSYGQTGDAQQALLALRRACDSDPGSATLLGDRVILEHRMGQRDQARKSFVRLVEVSGSEADWARMKAIGAVIGARIEED